MRGPDAARPYLVRHSPEHRNYDVAVNYFSAPHADDVAFQAAEFVFAGGLSKYHAAKRIPGDTGLLGKYEGVLFLDEDVALHFDPSEFFGYCRERKFSLAQPCLSHDSAGAWKITFRHPGFEFRLTNFVEVMAPYFSRDFLDAMVQSFDLSISGWGLDVFWGSQLCDQHSAAVVDRFTMSHLRPPDLHDGP